MNQKNNNKKLHMKGGREEKNEAFPELSWNKMILGDNSGNKTQSFQQRLNIPPAEIPAQSDSLSQPCGGTAPGRLLSPSAAPEPEVVPY